MTEGRLDSQLKAQFGQTGFIVFRNFFSKDVMQRVGAWLAEMR